MSRHTVTSRRQRLAATTLAAAGTVLLTATSLWGPVVRHALALTSAAGISAAVSVNANQAVAVVPSTAVGLNASTYDPNVKDSAVPGLVKTAGVNLMRFPGGTESDQYDWKTDTDVLSGATQPTNFDQFMNVASQAGTEPMITVNYGTGNTIGDRESPKQSGAQVAADWVNYANVQHHYGIKYWEIGNEVYGNGTYGAYWEPDDHCGAIPPAGQPSNCGPAVYAQNVRAYVQAMKAVDPGISIGVVLTTPGSWPDGLTVPGSPQSWNQTVLSALQGIIDFADVHWYPQNPSSVTPPGPSDAGLLAATDQIPGIVQTLRSQLGQYGGDHDLPIMLTETNSVSSNPGKQTLSTVNALYLEQDYLSWIANGVTNVDWWQLHNNAIGTGDNEASLFGTTNYGDYGILSDGTCTTTATGQACEPAAETPFPAYYGLKLLGQFVHPGDTLVSTSSNQTLLRAYAVKSSDNTMRIMLVNDDPSNSYVVGLNYAGFNPSPGVPVVSSLSGTGTAIDTTTAGSPESQTLPPYSVTLIALQSATTSPSPSQPVSPTPSPSRSNSPSPSPTGGTGNSCHATYSTQSEWPGGFTAAVTVTNSGTAAWRSWKAAFAFGGDQRTTNYWNAGSLVQSGQSITATNASYNGTVAPGGSVSFGFQGTWKASDAPPSTLTVNGLTCS